MNLDAVYDDDQDSVNNRRINRSLERQRPLILREIGGFRRDDVGNDIDRSIAGNPRILQSQDTLLSRERSIFKANPSPNIFEAAPIEQDSNDQASSSSQIPNIPIYQRSDLLAIESLMHSAN